MCKSRNEDSKDKGLQSIQFSTRSSKRPLVFPETTRECGTDQNPDIILYITRALNSNFKNKFFRIARF